MHKYINEIFIENKELKDINPRACGEAQCEPHHSWGPNIRPCYLLHYVMSGQGVYKAPTKNYEVQAGQIFVILPNEVVAYEADGRYPWQYSWVCFESSLDLSDIFSRYVITAPECAHIFNALRDCASVATDREWYICGKIYELLSLLEPQRTINESKAHRYVRMTLNFIDVYFQSPELRVSKMAEFLNLDRAYFSKIFRKYTGKSPQQYLVDFRLDRAAEMIVSQGLSPGEVAQRVGYSDIFNFSRMFRRRFGVPPSAYSSKKK